MNISKTTLLILIVFAVGYQYTNGQCQLNNAFGESWTATNNHSVENATTAGDLNNNGFDEIVYVKSFPQTNRGIYIYPNTNGVLGAAIQVYLNPGNLRGLECIDLDQDGLKDLVFGHSNQESVKWLKNLGNYEFSSAMDIMLNITDLEEIAHGDYDNDGDTDLLIARDSDDMVTWLENTMNEEGNWIKHDLGSLWRAYSVDSEDLNGDGLIDFVACGLFADQINIYMNLGDGAFSTGSSIGAAVEAPHSLSLLDLNNDDKMDLIVARNNHTLVWYRGNGDGTFSSRMAIGDINAPGYVVPIDYNCDGKSEAVVATDDGIYIYELNENQTWTVQQIGPVNDNYSSVAVGHINSTSSLDVVLGRIGTGPGVLWVDGLCQCEISTACFGDFNNDQIINTADLNALLSQFGTACLACSVDLNNDGVVNIADLVAFLTVYGTPC